MSAVLTFAFVYFEIPAVRGRGTSEKPKLDKPLLWLLGIVTLDGTHFPLIRHAALIDGDKLPQIPTLLERSLQRVNDWSHIVAFVFQFATRIFGPPGNRLETHEPFELHKPPSRHVLAKVEGWHGADVMSGPVEL